MSKPTLLQVIHRFGPFELRVHDRCLFRDGRLLAVEPKILDVIACLAARSHRVVHKSELLENVWGDVAVSDGVVHRCISRARRILEDGRKPSTVIATRGRRGYQFACEVQTVRVSESVDAPALLRAVRASERFVGRAVELSSALARLAAMTESGRGAAINIVGEPGIGKSELLSELSAQAEREDILVLASQCSEVPGAAPFRPWIEILRDVHERSEVPGLFAEVGAGPSDLAALLPELDVGRGSVAPAVVEHDQSRLRLFDTIERALTRVARTRPTLIVIDDLHCADDMTIHMWRVAAQAAARLPLVVAAGYRDLEADRHHLLSTIEVEQARARHCTRLRLEPMGSEEVELLVGHVLEAPFIERFGWWIYEKSEGNPFFALELARHLRQGGGERGTHMLEARISRARVEPGDRVRAVLSARLESVPARCLTVLRSAAVVGREFDRSLLTAVCETSSAAVDRAIEEALSARLIDEAEDAPGFYRFRHILVRDVLYGGIASVARPRMHRRVAECLRERAVDPSAERLDEIAHHYTAAVTGGCAEEAVEYSLAAADAALRRLAFEDAARLYERALFASRISGTLDGERAARIQLQSAECLSMAGQDARAEAAYLCAATGAREIGHAEILARAAMGAAVRFGQPVDFGDASPKSAGLLEEALAVLPEQPSALQALVLACLAFSSYGSGDPKRATAFAHRSERSARAVDDRYSLSIALLAQHIVSMRPGDSATSSAIADELIRVAESSGIDQMALLALTYRVFRCLETATDADELSAVVADRARLADRVSDSKGAWWTDVIEAARVLLAGDWRRGDALSRRARERASFSLNSNQEMAHRSQQTQILMLRGDFGGVLELSRSAAEQFPDVQASRIAYVTLLALAGDRTEGLEAAATWRSRSLVDALQPANWLFEAACLAELACTLEDRELGRRLYDFLQPFADHNVILGQGIVYAGPVARLLALLASRLGRHRDASLHFDRARRRVVGLAAKPWQARLDAEQAHFLWSLDKREHSSRVKELLCAAGATAESLGAPGVQAEVAVIEARME